MKKFIGIFFAFIVITIGRADDFFYNLSFENQFFGKEFPVFLKFDSKFRKFKIQKNKDKLCQAVNKYKEDFPYLLELLSYFVKNTLPSSEAKEDIVFVFKFLKQHLPVCLASPKERDFLPALKLYLNLWEDFYLKKEKVSYQEYRKKIENLPYRYKKWLLLVLAVYANSNGDEEHFKDIFKQVVLDTQKLLTQKEEVDIQYLFFLTKLLLTYFYKDPSSQILVVEFWKKIFEAVKSKDVFDLRKLYFYFKPLLYNDRVLPYLTDAFLIFFYQLGLKFEPFNLELKNNLAYIFLKYPQTFSLGEKMIDEVLEIRKNSPYFLDTKGWALFKKGDYTNAEKFLLEAYRKKNDIPDLLYHLASLYYTVGDYKKSIFFFEQAVNLASDTALYLNDYAYLLIDNDIDYQEGLALAKKAVYLDPFSPSYLDTLAWGLFKTGKINVARDILEKITARTSNAELKYHLACVYLGEGNLDKAKEAAFNGYLDEADFSKNLSLLGDIEYLQATLSKNGEFTSLKDYLLAQIYERYYIFSKALYFYQKAMLKAKEEGKENISKYISLRLEKIKKLLASFSDNYKYNFLKVYGRWKDINIKAEWDDYFSVSRGFISFPKNGETLENDPVFLYFCNYLKTKDKRYYIWGDAKLDENFSLPTGLKNENYCFFIIPDKRIVKSLNLEDVKDIRVLFFPKKKEKIISGKVYLKLDVEDKRVVDSFFRVKKILKKLVELMLNRGYILEGRVLDTLKEKSLEIVFSISKDRIKMILWKLLELTRWNMVEKFYKVAFLLRE